MSPCRCAAYPFPHRPDSGKCANPGTEPHSCGECHFSQRLVDPYGTGDRWYSITECAADDGCPWGKD